MKGKKMKKSLVLKPAALFIAGLFMSACPVDTTEAITDDFSLAVTADKTSAKVGDTVTATVVFKNLSGGDIEAEIPDWLIGTLRKPIEDYTVEDILFTYFITWDNFEWDFIDIAIFNRPVILIKSGAVIERQFKHTVTESKNIEIHAGVFFITTPETAMNYGWQIVCSPIKIRVR